MTNKKIEYVNTFYNKFGWSKKKGNTLDATLFEDLRSCAKKYVSKCRLRLNRFIPKKGKNILDFASGPIQYREYLDYSKNFKIRHCVDFSKLAINSAKNKLGKRGKYYCNDFFKIKFKKNYFDCILSLHTIYHIDKNLQSNAINKLLYISKKNSPIIIVYSNPNTFLSRIKQLFTSKKKLKMIFIFFAILLIGGKDLIKMQKFLSNLGDLFHQTIKKFFFQITILEKNYLIFYLF